MNENSVAEALRALVTSGSKKSETARLRLVFDEIELAFESGVSRESMLETLHAQGFTMALRSFDNAMYRLRKEREALQAEKPSKQKPLRVHASEDTGTRAAAPQGFTPKVGAESGSENTGNSAPGEQASIEPVAIAGKTKTEQVLATAPKAFSFKQLQQAKDPK